MPNQKFDPERARAVTFPLASFHELQTKQMPIVWAHLCTITPPPDPRVRLLARENLETMSLRPIHPRDEKRAYVNLFDDLYVDRKAVADVRFAGWKIDEQNFPDWMLQFAPHGSREARPQKLIDMEPTIKGLWLAQLKPR